MPEREQLESFASHQTSMAIYLSVQRIHRVAERLIEGGYPATTPVAVIYKATAGKPDRTRHHGGYRRQGARGGDPQNGAHSGREFHGL